MIQRVPRADMAAFPSKCLSCGSPAKPSVVFDVVQDWTGRMILCIECLTDAATQFCDVAPRALLEEADSTVRALAAREARFDSLLSDFNEGIARVSANFYRDLDAIADDSSRTQPVLEFPDDSIGDEPEHQVGGIASSQGTTGVSVDFGVFGADTRTDPGIRPL